MFFPQKEDFIFIEEKILVGQLKKDVIAFNKERIGYFGIIEFLETKNIILNSFQTFNLYYGYFIYENVKYEFESLKNRFYLELQMLEKISKLYNENVNTKPTK